MEIRTTALRTRLTGLFTAAAMAVSLVPVQELTSLSAYAADPGDASKIGLLEAGKPRHGTGWNWDGTDTLTLFGAELSSSDSAEPAIEPACDINIELINYNKVELSGSGSLLNTELYTVTIDGSGILDFSAASTSGAAIGAKSLDLDGGLILADDCGFSMQKDLRINGGYLRGENASISLGQGCNYIQTGGAAEIGEVTAQGDGYVTISGGYSELTFADGIEYSEIKGGILRLMNTSLSVTQIRFYVQAILMAPDLTTADFNGVLLCPARMAIQENTSNGIVFAGTIWADPSDVTSTDNSIYSEGNDLKLSSGTYGGSIYSAGHNFSIRANGSVNIGDNVTLYGDNGAWGMSVDISDMAFGSNTTVIGLYSDATSIVDEAAVEGRDVTSAPDTIIGITSGNGNTIGVILDNCTAKDVISCHSGEKYWNKYALILNETGADSVTAYSHDNEMGASVNNTTATIGELSAYSAEEAALSTTESALKNISDLGVYSGTSSTPINEINGDEISFSELGNRSMYVITDEGNTTGAIVESWIGNSLYIGAPLFDLVSKDTIICDHIYAAAGAGTFSAGIVVSRPDSLDDVTVTVSRGGNDVTGDFDIEVKKMTITGYADEGRLGSVNITSLNDLTVGSEFDVTVSYGDSSVLYKMTVEDIDLTLNFTLAHGDYGNDVQWNYGGSFTGYEDNCSGSGWAWYGSAADGYAANTLVLDGLQFNTTAEHAVIVPGGTTIVVKGTNSISSVLPALYANRGTTNITGEDGSRLIAASQSCYRGEGAICMDSDAELVIKGVDLEITAGDGQVMAGSGSTASSIGISAYSITIEDSDISITCGDTVGGSYSAGIKTLEDCILKDDVTLTVKKGDHIAKAIYPGHVVKTLQAKALSNLADYADAAAYNNAIASGAVSSLDIADNSIPATFSTYKITQVKTAKTDDILTRNSTISVDLNECFEGGSGKYVFTAPADFPSWLTLGSNGKITLSGSIPDEDHSSRIFRFTVTDADTTFAGTPLEFNFILGATGNVYPVKITSNYGGTVDPEAGTYYFVAGDSLTIKTAPFAGYMAKIFIDGTEAALTDGKYTLSGIDAAHEIRVKFQQTQYDVTVNCGDHGTVTPGSGKYNADSRVTFTATPDNGYNVDSFKVNGSAVTLTDNSYTLTVTEDTTINVTFRKKTSGGGGRPVYPVKPKDPSEILPSIGGTIFDWDQVVEYILSHPEKITVTVNLNGLTSVPKKVNEALLKMKDTGVFVVDSSRACIVYADREFTPYDMDLGMLYGTTSADGLRGVTGMKLDISGSSLVPYTLRATFRKEFAGQIANIYRMTANGAVFVDAAPIDADGNAFLDNAYTKDSYIVMIDALSDMPGDADNNGEFNALDASAVIKHAAGTGTAANTAMADFNGDGRLDALDAAEMLRKIVG